MDECYYIQVHFVDDTSGQSYYYKSEDPATQDAAVNSHGFCYSYTHRKAVRIKQVWREPFPNTRGRLYPEIELRRLSGPEYREAAKTPHSLTEQPTKEQSIMNLKIETVTFINGTPAKDHTIDQILDLIRKVDARREELKPMIESTDSATLRKLDEELATKRAQLVRFIETAKEG